MANSLCKCGTISIEGLKMSVDEIDTIANRLGTKANFAAKLHTNKQRYTGIGNSLVCEIVTSVLPL